MEENRLNEYNMCPTESYEHVTKTNQSTFWYQN